MPLLVMLLWNSVSVAPMRTYLMFQAVATVSNQVIWAVLSVTSVTARLSTVGQAGMVWTVMSSK